MRYNIPVINPDRYPEGDEKFALLWDMPINPEKPISFLYWENPAFRDMPEELLSPAMEDYKIRRNKTENKIQQACLEYALHCVRRKRRSGAYQFAITAEGLTVSGRKWAISQLAIELGAEMARGDWSIALATPDPQAPIKPRLTQRMLARALGTQLGYNSTVYRIE